MILAAGREGELEKKVRVHRIQGTSLRNEDDRIIIEGDDVRNLDDRGFVSLSQLRVIYGKARKKLDAEQYKEFTETNKIIGETLLDEMKAGEVDVDERANAVKFLELFYQVEIPLVRLPQDPPLTREEKREMDDVFGGAQWNGAPSAAQRDILRRYGLAFKPGSGHGSIYVAARTGLSVSVSSTPGDENAGHAVGRDVARLINTYRRTSRTKEEYKLPD
jgi:hypothetical protein